MVDPTKLNQDKNRKKKTKEHIILNVFLFSFIGALAGSAVTILIHYFFVRSSIFFFLGGMGAYALYLYFVEECDRKKSHIILLFLSTLLATIIVTFFDFMLLDPSITNAEGNSFAVTFQMYIDNISTNFFSNTVDRVTIEGNTTEAMNFSVLFINTVNYFFALIGLFFSWLFVKIATSKHEKKYGKAAPGTSYGYASRKKKTKKRK